MSEQMIFDTDDLHGLSRDIIIKQLQDFKTGFPYADIISPATIGNGVRPMLDKSYAE